MIPTWNHSFRQLHQSYSDSPLLHGLVKSSFFTLATLSTHYSITLSLHAQNVPLSQSVPPKSSGTLWTACLHRFVFVLAHSYRAMLCIARTMPTQDMSSVRPFVCPPHAGILSKRLNISSYFFTVINILIFAVLELWLIQL